jgi:hypothetical protein
MTRDRAGDELSRRARSELQHGCRAEVLRRSTGAACRSPCSVWDGRRRTPRPPMPQDWLATRFTRPSELSPHETQHDLPNMDCLWLVLILGCLARRWSPSRALRLVASSPTRAAASSWRIRPLTTSGGQDLDVDQLPGPHRLAATPAASDTSTRRWVCAGAPNDQRDQQHNPRCQAARPSTRMSTSLAAWFAVA